MSNDSQQREAKGGDAPRPPRPIPVAPCRSHGALPCQWVADAGCEADREVCEWVWTRSISGTTRPSALPSLTAERLLEETDASGERATIMDPGVNPVRRSDRLVSSLEDRAPSRGVDEEEEPGAKSISMPREGSPLDLLFRMPPPCSASSMSGKAPPATLWVDMAKKEPWYPAQPLASTPRLSGAIERRSDLSLLQGLRARTTRKLRPTENGSFDVRPSTCR